MSDKQPIGPALAQTLGGTWDGDGVDCDPWYIHADSTGRVWLDLTADYTASLVALGTLSDGVDALAQAARNHGVGT